MICELYFFLYFFNPQDMFIDFRERGRRKGGEGGEEKERETLIGFLSYMPWLGIEPTT